MNGASPDGGGGKGPGMGRPLGLTRTPTTESSLSTAEVQLRPQSSFGG